MTANFLDSFKEELNQKDLEQNPLNYVLEREVFNEDSAIVSVGIKDGRSIRAIIQAQPTSNVYGIDDFKGLEQDWREGYPKGSFASRPKNIVRRINYYNDDVMTGCTKLAKDLKDAGTSKIDLLHIDCETYTSSRNALFTLSEFITNGTFIVFDEIINYPGYEEHEVKALEEFLLASRKCIYVVGMNGPVNSPQDDYFAHQKAVVRVYDRDSGDLIITDDIGTDSSLLVSSGSKNKLTRNESKNMNDLLNDQLIELQQAAKKAKAEALEAANNASNSKASKKIQKEAEKAAKEVQKKSDKVAKQLQKEYENSLSKDEKKEYKAKLKAEMIEEKNAKKEEKKRKKSRKKLMKRASTRTINMGRVGQSNEIIDEEAWDKQTAEVVDNTVANGGDVEKVYLVIPYGRRLYFDLLLSYVLRDIDLFDMVYLWKNTNNIQDLEHLAALNAKLPMDKFTIIEPELSNSEVGRISGVYPLYALPIFRDPNALIIKIDDDVVYAHEEAFKNLIDFSREHRQEYTVFGGNTINSGPIDSYHQSVGASANLPVINLDNPYKVLHSKKGKGALHVHTSFFKAINREEGRDLSRYLDMGDYVYLGHPRWSINVLAFFGDTFSDDDLIEILKDDEKYITEKFGKEKKEENCKYSIAVGSSLFVHFCYSKVNNFDPENDIISMYYELAGLTSIDDEGKLQIDNQAIYQRL